MAYHHGDLKTACLAALPLAIEAFGLEKLSLREIARRAGVSHGAPAHHFGDKRGLLTAFAVDGSERLTEAVLKRVGEVEESDHVRRLVAVGVGYLEFAIEHKNHLRVMFRPELLDMLDPALREARARAGASLDEVLLAAQADQRLAEKNYPMVRTAAFALAHWYACLALDVFDSMTEQQLLRQALEAFMHFSTRMLD